VPLTTVKSGAGRPRPGTQVGGSDVMTACFVQIPKLIVRVRFPSPAPLKAQLKPHSAKINDLAVSLCGMSVSSDLFAA
jgi:hypothetical protein